MVAVGVAVGVVGVDVGVGGGVGGGAVVVVVIDPCFLITKLHSPTYSQQLSRLPIDGAAAEESEI